MTVQPSRGEVWFAALDVATTGREQAGHRPVLIVSTNTFNHGPADLIIVIPLTSSQRPYPYRVQIDPPDGQVRNVSYALCDAVRSISKDRLQRRWGVVSPEVLEQVEDYLRILLEL